MRAGWAGCARAKEALVFGQNCERNMETKEEGLPGETTGEDLDVDEVVAELEKSRGKDVVEIGARGLNMSYIGEYGLECPLHAKQGEIPLGLMIPVKSSVETVVSRLSPTQSLCVYEKDGWQEKTYSEVNSAKDETLIKFALKDTLLDRRLRPPDIVNELDLLHTVGAMNSNEQIRTLRKFLPQKLCFVQFGQKRTLTDFSLEDTGASVWLHLVTGRCTFYLCPPSQYSLDDFIKNKKTYLKTFVASQKQETNSFHKKKKKETKSIITRIVIKPGETLFIPAAYLYASIFDQDTLAFGGLFLERFSIDRQCSLLHSFPHNFKRLSPIYWLTALRSFYKLYYAKSILDTMNDDAEAAHRLLASAFYHLRNEEFYAENTFISSASATRRLHAQMSLIASPHNRKKKFKLLRKQDDDAWLAVRRFVLAGNCALMQLRLLSIALRDMLDDQRLAVSRDIPNRIVSPHLFLDALDAYLDGTDLTPFERKEPQWLKNKHLQNNKLPTTDSGWCPGHYIPIPGLYCGQSSTSCYTCNQAVSDDRDYFSCAFCQRTQHLACLSPAQQKIPLAPLSHGRPSHQQLWACPNCETQLTALKEKILLHPSADSTDHSSWWWLDDFADLDREAWCKNEAFFTQTTASLLRLRQWSRIKSKKSIRIRCGKCSACLAENCGNCRECLDMKSFGGAGRLRQCCVKRRCIQIFQNSASHTTTTPAGQEASLSPLKAQPPSPPSDEPPQKKIKTVPASSALEPSDTQQPTSGMEDASTQAQDSATADIPSGTLIESQTRQLPINETKQSLFSSSSSSNSINEAELPAPSAVPEKADKGIPALVSTALPPP